MAICTESAGAFFVAPARAALRREIQDHGGNEVFFVGHPGSATGKVQSVEALCRGNSHAVPAILEVARQGDVVIHNHPSGQLVPSDPDVALAAQFSDRGVGFLIVDNDVDQVLQVVKPFVARPEIRVTLEEVAESLGAGGSFSRTMPGFEYRPGQLEMARMVLEAFNDHKIAVVEAGTGTGKSLAYLVPAAACALANDSAVVIATRTINLQEQLYNKDCPQVTSLPGFEGLRVAMLKGRGNYLCLRKHTYHRRQGDLFDNAFNEALETLEAWAAKTRTGERSEIGFPLPNDLWETIAADESTCTRVKCPHYDDCFYFRARREASGAHILIANQHLLMADLEVRFETGDYKRAIVLPPCHRIVLDEAHHLEEVATSFASGTVSSLALARLLNRLHVPAADQRGKRHAWKSVVPLLFSRLREVDGSERVEEILDRHLVPRAEQLRRQVRSTFQEVALELLAGDRVRGGRFGQQVRVDEAFESTAAWRDTIRPRLEDLQGAMSLLAGAIDMVLDAWKALPETFRQAESHLRLELATIRGKLAAASGRLRAFLEHDDNRVRWFELEKVASSKPRAALCTAPVDVSKWVRETVFEPMKTVVLTSATLSVVGRFDYFNRRVGLEAVPAGRRIEKTIPTSFDMGRQAMLAIPTDVPDPRGPGFRESLVEVLEEAVALAGGGAFILFTSYHLMNDIFGALQERGSLPYPFLRQGEDSRHRLLSRFKAGANSVLFGTSSFWEGVDVQGDALRLVAITRLPFQVPSDPIQVARAESVAARGGDPFREISLPEAVLQFKQGFGRLIRHREDRGVVLVLDSRIVSKSYGRLFLDAVAPVTPVAAPARVVLRAMGAFFRGLDAGGPGWSGVPARSSGFRAAAEAPSPASIRQRES